MRNQKNFTRITAALFQAVIDAFVFRLSFFIVIAVYMDGKIPHTFTPEVQIFFTGTMLTVFYFNSLYSFKTWLLWDEMKAVLKSSLMILLVVVLYLYSQKFDLSRFTISAGIIIFVPLCITSRYIFRRAVFALGLLSTNIVILGAGRIGSIFAEKISTHPFTLGKIIAFLDDDESKHGLTISGAKVFGSLEDFDKLCDEMRIDEAAVAISNSTRSLLTHILGIVEFRVRQVHYVPDMYMLTTFSSSVRDVDGVPVISASQGLLNPYNRLVKSVVDYAGAAVIFAVLLPLMALTAASVEIAHGGEIFSWQERSGLGGKSFMLCKFRSSELGRTGKLIRKYYLDELPQLFNVLKGEMSLVGPKAFTEADMIHVYGRDTARKISKVKPGITGFWQVNDRENYKRICGEMNLYYIRNWSLWLDLVIFLKTIQMIFTRRTA